MDYDLKLVNGNILTDDGFIDSAGIKNGLFSSMKPHGPSKKTMDLNGKYVIPGFIDAHTHMLTLGLQQNKLNFENVNDISTIINMVYQRSLSDEKIITGYNWDESLWHGEYITKKDLDIVKKPVILYRRDLHTAALNSKALETLNIDSNNGIINEELMRKIEYITEPDENEIISALKKSIGISKSYGVTTFRDMVDLKTYNAYKNISSCVTIYKSIYSNFYFNGFGSNMGDLGIKIFMDGSIGSGTAAHINSKNLKMDTNSLIGMANSYWNKNLPLAVHAIGEVAIDTVLKAFSKSPGKIRNSVEHFELMNDDTINNVNDSTVISSQPNYLQWNNDNGMYENALGKEWLSKNNSFRHILDAGKHLAFGSDCMPFNPFYGINFAINSKYSNQRINIFEAIKAYTHGSAYLLGKEKYMGKIENNYRADFIILDDNFFKNLNDISMYKPVETFINGISVFKR